MRAGAEPRPLLYPGAVTAMTRSFGGWWPSIEPAVTASPMLSSAGAANRVAYNATSTDHRLRPIIGATVCVAAELHVGCMISPRTSADWNSIVVVLRRIAHYRIVSEWIVVPPLRMMNYFTWVWKQRRGIKAMSLTDVDRLAAVLLTLLQDSDSPVSSAFHDAVMILSV